MCEIILLSTFYFSNYKHDVVKNDIIDVLNKNSQNYLDCLTDRLSRFEPDKVLLEFKNKFESAVSEMQSLENELHKNSALENIFKYYNSIESEQKNKKLYLLTNQLGAGAHFTGADASASWWHRNFRMFANIQK